MKISDAVTNFVQNMSPKEENKMFNIIIDVFIYANNANGLRKKDVRIGQLLLQSTSYVINSLKKKQPWYGGEQPCTDNAARHLRHPFDQSLLLLRGCYYFLL